MSANPTWYDILGVAPDASPEEIKAAWRNATDKFEPGSGTSQFRLFNEAADTLLDPQKRAAYDAELGAPAPAAVDEPAVDEPAVEEPAPVELADLPPAPPAAPAGRFLAPLASLSNLVLAMIAVVGVAALVVVLVLALNLRGRVDDANAGPDATAAATRALTVVLAYDYRHMDADRDRAIQFLTPSYQKQYEKTFSLLTTAKDGGVSPVAKTKTVVTADVLATAVQDADSHRVRVIAFVNQSATKDKATGPSIFQNRVVVTMVHRGGDWLVDDVKSY
jgi:Mce-associated membrane protein